MESKLNDMLNKNQIRVLVLDNHTVTDYDHSSYDLVISGFGIDKPTIKSIIDEEKCLAFGG